MRAPSRHLATGVRPRSSSSPLIAADDSRFFLVQEELQRLLVDEAEEAEANCTVDELLSALRKTHRAMTVEESALRAFLKVLDEDGVINIMLDIIEMALILSTDDDADDE